MPIRPENVARYPQDWPAIRASILVRAGDCCEGCGVPNGAIGWRDERGAFVPIQGSGEAEAADGRRVIRIVLTIAHLDHVPEHCEPDNLRAWCQRCHNAYDAPMRAKGIKVRRPKPLLDAGASS